MNDEWVSWPAPSSGDDGLSDAASTGAVLDDRAEDWTETQSFDEPFVADGDGRELVEVQSFGEPLVGDASISDEIADVVEVQSFGEPLVDLAVSSDDDLPEEQWPGEPRLDDSTVGSDGDLVEIASYGEPLVSDADMVAVFDVVEAESFGGQPVAPHPDSVDNELVAVVSTGDQDQRDPNGDVGLPTRAPDLPLERPVPTPDDGIDARFLNRELSWLQFNERVLSLASEPGIPLLERAKFVAIASTNLDEFYQVRVAALKDTIAAGLDRPTPDGRTPAKQLADIGDAVPDFVERLDNAFVDQLVPELAAAGVEIVHFADLSSDEIVALDGWFDERVFPVLTPLAVDPGHPFPYISDLALSLAVNVADPETGDRRFARLKVPNVFPRLVEVAVGRFLPVEELIAAKLDQLFVGMIVEEWAPFRVSRNADLTVEEEEAEDLLEAVEMELRRRRFNRAVRLEVGHDIGAEILELLVRELDLTHDDVTFHRSPLDLSCLWELMSLDRPDLKDDLWKPITAGRLAAAEESDRPIVEVIRHRSMLVHHPYESFSSSVEEFISQAASDPKVQSIKMTLYRAGGDSAVIRSLIRAAENGKQVAVLVELKARFDEATNVQWAKQLERAGVHVVYGMVGLKTHSKIVLVVRDDGDQLRRYCHIGTGNYNAKTAKIYEDLGLFTCDEDVGADALELFNHLTGYSRAIDYRTLLVAPRDLRRQLADLIEHESSFGVDGHITIKCNSIADPEMVEALYAAGQAGVRIDLIVRGICCLRPGVPGLSENIRVRSVLGRFLEHSRIFRFAHGNRVGPGVDERIDNAETDALHLIGSADLMPRNLTRRVEVLVPIDHPRHIAWLDKSIDFALADDVVAWEQQPDDTWLRLGPTDSFEPHPQSRMYEWTVEQQSVGRRAPE